MTADGRLIKTDPVALGVWKRLTDQFSVFSIVLTAMFSGRALFPWRVDNLTMMTQTDRWKIGQGLLGGLDNAQIDFLTAYAAINARRVEHVFRAFALLLVSVPIAATVGLNEIHPEVWDTLNVGFLSTLIAIILVWALFAGLMLATAWRARDLVDLLEFEQARRRLDDVQNGPAEAQAE